MKCKRNLFESFDSDLNHSDSIAPLVAAALIGGGSALLGSAVNYFSNKHINDKVNQTNKEIANQNIAYQKEYNETIFNREDTANTRAISDMRAAGLNPLANYAASGSGGSSAAPFNNYQAQGFDSAIDFSAAVGAASQLASLSQVQKQNDILSQEAKLKALEASYAEKTLSTRIAQSHYIEADQYQNLVKKAYDNDYQQYYGIHDYDSREERIAKVLATDLVREHGYKNWQPNLGYVSNSSGTVPLLSEKASGYGDYPQPQDMDLKSIFRDVKGKIPDSVYKYLKALMGE